MAFELHQKSNNKKEKNVDVLDGIQNRAVCVRHRALSTTPSTDRQTQYTYGISNHVLVTASSTRFRN